MIRITLGRMISVIVAAAAVTMMLAGSADAQSVSVSVTPGTLAITVTNSSVPFGIVALGTTIATDVDAITPASIENTGGLTPSTLTLEFDNASEASCDTGSWAAHISAAGTNQFVMDVALDNSTTDDSVNIPPFSGSPVPTGDLLTDAGTGIANLTDSIDLDFSLKMPTDVSTTGPCSMAMTLVVA